MGRNTFLLFKYTEFVLLHYSTCRKLLVCNPSSPAPKNTNWIGHQNFPKKKRIKWIYWWMPQNVWRGINSNPSQSLPKFFPTYFMRPVTFEQTKVLQENKTTGSLRNVNSKLLNKICANQIQPDIQRTMYHNQLISSTRMLWQTRLNNAIYCIYRMKDKIQNPPNRFRKKVFGKNQTLFYVKNNLNKTLNRRKLSQANKRNLWGTHSQIRRWHPTPVLLPGKSHGWRSPVGWSPWGRSESDRTERLHFHFSPSCIGEGNGNPLQCSCLENPRDRAVWWAAVYGVAQSRTRLKWLSSIAKIILNGERLKAFLWRMDTTPEYRLYLTSYWKF